MSLKRTCFLKIDFTVNVTDWSWNPLQNLHYGSFWFQFTLFPGNWELQAHAQHLWCSHVSLTSELRPLSFQLTSC